MKHFFKSYHTIIGMILLLYFIPIIMLISYTLSVLPSGESWKLLSCGLFFSILATLCLFVILKSWEAGIKRQPPTEEPQDLDAAFLQQAHENQETLNKTEEELKTLAQTFHIKEKELDKLLQEKEHFHQRKEELLQEFSHCKKTLEEELQQKKVLIVEYQQTIADQRKVIEKKQTQLEKYDTKVNDLTYEIKTLLKLAETSSHLQSAETQAPLPHKAETQTPLSHKNVTTQPEDKSIRTKDDAVLQLKKCLNIAQKLTGSSPFNGSGSRFPNMALDQRRLFENLQSESTCAIFVYSQKEKKLLFANRYIQHLVGWEPDKFIQIFDSIIEDGLDDWKNRICHLNTKDNSDFRLIVKAKSGEDVFVHCHMGLIPSGNFRNHVIGILYPDN